MQRVLFLCVYNSARSQIAEGLLRALAGERFQVFSAGSEPTQLNPFAVRVLQDEGIDISQQCAKNVNEFINQPFDYVITLCAEEVCPTFPSAAKQLHWELPDPAAVEGNPEEKLEAFRQTVAQLKSRVGEFLRERNAETKNDSRMTQN